MNKKNTYLAKYSYTSRSDGSVITRIFVEAVKDYFAGKITSELLSEISSEFEKNPAFHGCSLHSEILAAIELPLFEANGDTQRVKETLTLLRLTCEIT